MGRGLANRAGMLLGAALEGLGSSRPAVFPLALMAAGAAAVLFLLVLAPRARSRLRRILLLPGKSPGRLRSEAIVRLYQEALGRLRRLGCKRADDQTPLEFSRELAGEPFGEALARLTALYNRARFGGDSRAGDIAQARELLHALRRRR